MEQKEVQRTMDELLREFDRLKFTDYVVNKEIQDYVTVDKEHMGYGFMVMVPEKDGKTRVGFQVAECPTGTIHKLADGIIQQIEAHRRGLLFKTMTLAGKIQKRANDEVLPSLGSKVVKWRFKFLADAIDGELTGGQDLTNQRKNCIWSAWNSLERKDKFEKRFIKQTEWLKKQPYYYVTPASTQTSSKVI